MKAFIDRGLEKVLSRKLLVWLTGTTALLAGNLESDDWVTISVVYIGTQAAVDIVERIRRAKA